MEYDQLLVALPDEETVEPFLNILTGTIVSILSVVLAGSLYIWKRGLSPDLPGLSLLRGRMLLAPDAATIEAGLVRAGILLARSPALPIFELESPAPAVIPRPTGYLHSQYACSLSAYGVPYYLPEAQGWLIRRPIPGTPHYDAMGTYPLFCCNDWPLLAGDLRDLAAQLVCVSLVTDPFGNFVPNDLKKFFSDACFPYKEHLVTDLSQPDREIISRHHWRNLRRAQRKVNVHLCADPVDFLDDWVQMYENLVRRHHITGIPVFSRNAFARQLTVPGIVALRAEERGATVGMLLWYRQNDVAYYHLGAYTPRGYELSASYPLFEASMHYFRSDGLRWLSLGAGAGIRGNDHDGLTRFKMGWATGTRTVYFCGRIFNREIYQAVTRQAGREHSKFFPAFRDGEYRRSEASEP